MTDLTPAEITADMTLDIAWPAFGYTTRATVVVQSARPIACGPFGRKESALYFTLGADMGGKTPLPQGLVWNADDGRWYIETSYRQRLDYVVPAAPDAVLGRRYNAA